MILLKATSGQVILSNLKLAESLLSRMKGLLGANRLEPDQGLWIKNCNSIHTFFMKFAIDCIFVDSKLKVIAVHSQVTPGRLIWPQWGANSVIEVSAGTVDRFQIQVGEVLDARA